MADTPDHPLAILRRHTAARIALGRHGAGLPTSAHLDFAEAHAKARDAVHAGFDEDAIARRLSEGGVASLAVSSQADGRASYLRRPDLGRSLSGPSRQALTGLGGPAPDLCVVIGDGLSAHAVNTYASETALAILALLPGDWRIAPVLLATGARVALSDPIGEALGAGLVLMLIGERPGLSAADSLGAYITHSPRIGRTDADRNCVSNIRAGGLAPPLAAVKLAGFLTRSRALGFSGVRLKDDEGLIEAAPEAVLLSERPV
ncbi:MULTISPECIES: ethanolamine ammonia-lyase subunit EutC [unclassified Aureimonas]|uniref:ethanolamine ammonia-lyase subunit EutC n=1 Tax=unclassified Aureimonas TaxID=2615206 RepID=UPI0006F732E6|nr:MULTISPECIES: ethanolamine ammonia-lyase subunit EutC [unclassified Aureimonas]KQT69675.1 hypothetical protein ASG62_00655 [Aureimonas sp. Leaf427]KQT76172.1 hypothetical protein ASG54_15565 [Aureimonas sp. Leaf460]